MVVAKKILYVNRFVGEPKPSDFRLVEEVLPELQDGGLFTFELNNRLG